MSFDDAEPNLADPVAGNLLKAADMQHHIAVHGEDDPDFLEEAVEALRRAANDGARAWSAPQREELDAVVRSLASTLRRAGVLVEEEATRLRPFKGRPPSFAPMGHDELFAALEAGEPIVARRLVAPEGGAQIEAKELHGAHILDCTFINWSFDDVDLSHARIMHSVFQGCSFDGTNLSRAVATTCRFDGHTPDGTSPFRVTAPNANLSGSYLGSFDIRGACFEDAAFSYAYLWSLNGNAETTFDRALFDLSTLDQVDGRGTSFREAMFVGATFLSVDLRAADLRGASFSSSRVAGAHFQGAKLENAGFRTAYFVGLADFDESGLEADLLDADRDTISAALKCGDEADAEVDLHTEDKPEQQ